MTVHCVFYGFYDDLEGNREFDGVFSTRERAIEHVKSHNSHYDLELKNPTLLTDGYIWVSITEVEVDAE